MKTGFILIRGLARNSKHWGDFEDHLKKSFGGHEIRYFELPGLGPKHHEQYPNSISQVTDILKKELSGLPSNIKWVPIGISLGGMIILDWMSRYPNDFDQGVIINSSVSNLPFYKRVKPKAIKELLECFLINDNQLRESKIFDLTSNSDRKSQIMPYWLELALHYPIKRETLIKQLSSAARFKLPKVNNELLILCSKNDQLCSFECSLYIYSNTRNSEVFINSSGGHDLPLDCPEWVTTQIKNFLP